MSFHVYKCQSMPLNLFNKIRSISQNEWGEVPIIKNTTWSEPDWMLTIEQNQQICASLHIVERRVVVGDKYLQMAGISNVIVSSYHRSEGLGVKLMNAAKDYFVNELQSECGLLLCGYDVSSFYEKLGWQKLLGKASYQQPGGIVTWEKDVFIHPARSNFVRLDCDIDLCGLPW